MRNRQLRALRRTFDPEVIELMQAVERQGGEVDRQRGSHVVMRLGDGTSFPFFPGRRADPRAIRNLRGELRRRGVDV